MKNEFWIIVLISVILTSSTLAGAQRPDHIPEDFTFTSIAQRSETCVMAAGHSRYVGAPGTYFIDACRDGVRVSWTIGEGFLSKMSFPEPDQGWLLLSHVLVRYRNGTMNKLNLKRIRNADFNSVAFGNSKQGCAAGQEGRIVCTFDGGKTWSEQTLEREFDLSTIAFSDCGIGWILGSDRGPTRDPLDDKATTIVLKTVDGGRTWRQSTIPLIRERIASLQFRGAVGWAITRSRGMFITTDRGASWQPVDFSNGWIEDATVVNAATVYVLADRFWRSDNLGHAWLTSASVPKGQPSDYTRMIFLDSQFGWMISQHNLAQTSDGGQTWTELF